MSATLQVGQKAPDFTLESDGNGTVSLADLAGQNVVLYFYPKDDTSGCTSEAKDFSAMLPAFKAANTMVIGVSPDTLASHAKFKSKYDLGVTLAADPAKDMLTQYGVWVEKSMYGRKYMGVERTTLLIDHAGKIVRVWNKVKVPGHAAEVLSAAKAL